MLDRQFDDFSRGICAARLSRRLGCRGSAGWRRCRPGYSAERCTPGREAHYPTALAPGAAAPATEERDEPSPVPRPSAPVVAQLRRRQSRSERNRGHCRTSRAGKQSDGPRRRQGHRRGDGRSPRRMGPRPGTANRPRRPAALARGVRPEGRRDGQIGRDRGVVDQSAQAGRQEETALAVVLPRDGNGAGSSAAAPRQIAAEQARHAFRRQAARVVDGYAGIR